MRKVVLDRVEVCVALCAEEKRETHYVPVAKVAGTFSGGSELSEALGVGHAADHKAGDPIRAALVVGVHTGIPGPGFFNMARYLGALKGNDPKDEFLFWKAQRDALGVDLSPEAIVTGKNLGVL